MRKVIVLAFMGIFLAGAGFVQADVVSHWNCNQNILDTQLIDSVGSANGILEDKTAGPPPSTAIPVCRQRSGAGWRLRQCPELH